MTPTLAQALEQEHVDIDAGIAAFTAGRDRGAPPVDTMLAALAALRRHIYLEETMLFPPLRAGGAFAALMVMLREHGQLWRTMDTLQPLIEAGGTDDAIPGLVADLVATVEAHNDKEEKIIYPLVDEALNGPATDELRAFMASGGLPEGWVCEQAAGGPHTLPFSPRA